MLHLDPGDGHKKNLRNLLTYSFYAEKNLNYHN